MITPLILSLLGCYLGGYGYIFGLIFFINTLGRCRDAIDVFNHIYEIDRNVQKYHKTHCQRQVLWVVYKTIFPEGYDTIRQLLVAKGYKWWHFLPTWYKRPWVTLTPRFIYKFFGGR